MTANLTSAHGIGSVYERLAFDLNDADSGTSLSGYQCDNPFVDDLIAAVRLRALTTDYRRYTYFDADDLLIESVRACHEGLDGYAPAAVVCGSGATSLLIGFVSYLRGKGINSVYYVPPLYFGLRVALERFGITAIALGERQPYEPDFALTLPEDSSSCLLVADPIWYSGTQLTEDTVSRLADWQRSTGSLICVDGSMQYLHWQGPVLEQSSRLDPSLTIRLLSPTKQLAVHGYRFAYFLAPERETRALAWSCATVAGAASAESVAFAHEAMDAIANGSLSRKIAEFAARRYSVLRRSGNLVATVEPYCGYQVFARIMVPIPSNHVLLDGRYFEQPRYPEHFKVNLLSPSIGILEAGTAFT